MNQNGYIPGGYVLISRQILASAIYSMPLSYRMLFFHCILRANHKAAKLWNGTHETAVPRGSFWTSLPKLSAETRIPKSTVQRGLTALRSASMLTWQAGNKGRLVTVCNYETYQNPDLYRGKQNDRQVGNKTIGNREASEQATEQQTIMENNGNNEKTPPQAPFSEADETATELPVVVASPSDNGQGKKLLEERGINPKTTDELLSVCPLVDIEARCQEWDLTDKPVDLLVHALRNNYPITSGRPKAVEPEPGYLAGVGEGDD